MYDRECEVKDGVDVIKALPKDAGLVLGGRHERFRSKDGQRWSEDIEWFDYNAHIEADTELNDQGTRSSDFGHEPFR